MNPNTLFAVKYDSVLEEVVKTYTRAQFPIYIEPEDEAGTPYPSLSENETIYVALHEAPDSGDVDERLFRTYAVFTPDPAPHPIFANYPTWRITWTIEARPVEEVKQWIAERVVAAHAERQQNLDIFEGIPGFAQMVRDASSAIMIAKIMKGKVLAPKEKKVLSLQYIIGIMAMDDLANAIQLMNALDASQTVDIDAGWQPLTPEIPNEV